MGDSGLDKANNSKRLRDDRRARGRCVQCGEPAAPVVMKGGLGEKCLGCRTQEQKRRTKTRYQLTTTQLEGLNARRPDGCMICGKREIPFEVLAIDHDHKDNRVRGLLCMRCNISYEWYVRLQDKIEEYGKEDFYD